MGKFHHASIKSYSWGAGDPEHLKRRLNDPKGIPEEKWIEVYEYMAGSYEKPSLEEGFNSIHFIDNDGMVIDENSA